MDDTDAQKQPYWAELEQLARPARERRRLPPETRSEIIVSLCRRAPLSVKDLSILLDRSEAYIGDAIRPLVTSGLLTFLYPDQPRHPRQKYMAATDVAIDLGPLDHPELDVPEEMMAPAATRGRSDGLAPSLPTHAPSVREETEAPRFPNQATNLIYVLVVGLGLGFTHVPIWWLIAGVAAFTLSWLHVARNSAQYQQFQALQEFLNRDRAFLVAKSTVTFAEILVVFLVVRLLTPLA